jgi:hypothetical protein
LMVVAQDLGILPLSSFRECIEATTVVQIAMAIREHC